MEIYSEAWAANYERLANASIAGREGLYRLCKAYLMNLPDDARVLVIGCGTGEELVVLAKALPRASFVAIDPARPMLALCAKRVADEGLSARIAIRNTTLADFTPPHDFDAATAILVSQHLSPDAAARAFFQRIAALLRPGGLLYSADLHIGAGQDRDSLLRLWRGNVIASGLEPEVADGMLRKIETEIRPRDEAAITDFLRNAGFTNILMPYRSLIYGAWAAEKTAA
ncbi:MAG: class I SAM-dependent methyltransferase [Rhodospirillales bacterium]|nr:MAG: class I SAM-dependent methyltransferase [Rhodospirillales bacterium]